MVSSSNNRIEFNFEKERIIFERNSIAKQADQSLVVHWNNTVLLLTLCVSRFPVNSDFLPLTVDFQDNLFSVGKIPGGFFRREGKPSEYSTLSSRIIDRVIRHLFPKDFRNEVQIVVSPLSIDHTLDIRVVAALNSSLALNASQLPIKKLFAAASIGYINNQFVFNPSYEELQKSELEMFLVGDRKEISMIEVSANQLSESKILEAIKFGHEKIVKLIDIQKQFLDSISISKKDYKGEELTSLKDLDQEIREFSTKKVNDWIESSNEDKKVLMEKLELEVLLHFAAKRILTELNDSDWKNTILTKLSIIIQKRVRETTVSKQKRIDGRGFFDIRPLSCKIDYLPIVHGSAIFNRGETQTLSAVTLGTTSSQKPIDDLTLDLSSHFMHHYKSLPFSMGTVQRLRGLSRREIGHGSLGEKALKRVLPKVSDFPYTIRVVSEVLASNGSTSQAAICSASLALMAAGVPIKSPVAGVAIGLIKEDNKYYLLSDIQAWEDFYGDMDFKIAGTEKGICSIQLDLKISGLPIEIVDKILFQGKKDRLKILEIMGKMISVSRQKVAKNAIKFAKLKLESNEIKILIGSNGQNIKRIIAEHNQPKIDIQEDGSVLIYHQDQITLDLIKDNILKSVKPVEVGEFYLGSVEKIAEYGAFVKLKGKNVSGLIHISNLSNKFVDDVNKIVKVGQEVKVQVMTFNNNKINLKLV